MQPLEGFWIFAILIFAILFSWSLVGFWERFLENLFYQTLGFNPDNTWVSLFVAILITCLFLLLVFIIMKSGLVPNMDMLLYDYDNSDINNASGQRARWRARAVGGKIAPRGAISTIAN